MKKIFIFLLFIIFLCFFTKEIFAIDKIDINTAPLSELDQLTGIGPAYAQKIIENRPYLSLDDLLKVKGIGSTTLQKIKDQALACVDCSVSSLREGSQADEAISTSGIATPSPAGSTRNDTNIVPIIYPGGVIINEILPSPEGADEENEFIELYNTNNFDINLSNWKIKDTEGTIVTFTIPINIKILANNFLVFKRPQTKISLNNTKDTLNLILPNNKIIDSVSFAKAPINQSYNKIGLNWLWSTNLSPNKQNIASQPSSNDSKISLLKTNNSGNNIIEANNLLATLSNNQDKIINKNNPWLLFLLVLGITIILSIIILVIKIKFNF